MLQTSQLGLLVCKVYSVTKGFQVHMRHKKNNYSLSCSLRVMSLPVSGHVSQTVTPWGGAHALYGGRWRKFRYNKDNTKRYYRAYTYSTYSTVI